MDLIGLSGGIGSGKSTVSGFLRELGARVIDADEGARAVVEPGSPGFAAVEAEFGPEVVRAGRLDRGRLAEIVFNDKQALERLNAIVHPLVRDWTAARLGEAAAEGAEVVVQDIPLLFENGYEPLFRSTILVHVPPALQLERLLARGMPEADARARIASQMPIDEKRSRATHVIDNSRTREETRAQTEKVWTEITASRSSGP
ncbi:MAG: dephospho-CoA kinase [Candidatus Dormibacteraeota bacterium]|nr:dephospho-CoA kinase [Candidatus Dormibacteraeota bacterium]